MKREEEQESRKSSTTLKNILFILFYFSKNFSVSKDSEIAREWHSSLWKKENRKVEIEGRQKKKHNHSGKTISIFFSPTIKEEGRKRKKNEANT